MTCQENNLLYNKSHLYFYIKSKFSTGYQVFMLKYYRVTFQRDLKFLHKLKRIITRKIMKQKSM